MLSECPDQETMSLNWSSCLNALLSSISYIPLHQSRTSIYLFHSVSSYLTCLCTTLLTSTSLYLHIILYPYLDSLYSSKFTSKRTFQGSQFGKTRRHSELERDGFEVVWDLECLVLIKLESVAYFTSLSNFAGGELMMTWTDHVPC